MTDKDIIEGKGDMGRAFNRLKQFIYVYHRHFRGERTSDGILFRGEKYTTIEAFQKGVDDLIKEGVLSIENSLNRLK